MLRGGFVEEEQTMRVENFLDSRRSFRLYVLGTTSTLLVAGIMK